MPVLAAIDDAGVVSASLVGSAAADGLMPESDLDVLVLTRRSLDASQRRDAVDRLLEVSGRRATVHPGRPIELVSLRIGDVVPWRYPATRDFGYGEWLRDEYRAGHIPAPVVDPNLPVVLASARDHAVPLTGEPVGSLLDPVPAADVRRSLHDALPSLVAGLVGDERNVLLTLARMLVTLETGQIVAKHVAAARVARELPEEAATVLARAAAAHRGRAVDAWDDADAVRAAADLLVGRIGAS